MPMRVTLLLAATVAGAWSTSSLAASPRYEAEREDISLARRAYAVFIHACPNLPRAIVQASEVKVVADVGQRQYAEEYKWEAMMVVTIRLRNGRGLMPAILADTASFREASFAVGGAPAPGVLPVTAAARAVCGLVPSSEGHEIGFVPMPALNFLNTWPSRVRPVPEGRDGTADPLGSRAVPQDGLDGTANPVGSSHSQMLAGLPWSYTGPPDKEGITRRVMETLRRLCPRIDQALPDFASFEGEYRRLPSFHTRYRGGYRILIEGGPVLASRRARVMPSPPFDPEDHTLFEVFGPPKPGIAMDKLTALWLCNARSPSRGGITFMPASEFNFIGR